MKYYRKALENYANFTGRARRSEYWFFVLINFIFTIIAVTLSITLSMATKSPAFMMIYLIYVLAMLIPSLSVATRRLHDIDKSGWHILLALIPLIGGLWLLVLLFTEGNKGSNNYGPDPKSEGTEVSDHLMNQV